MRRSSQLILLLTFIVPLGMGCFMGHMTTARTVGDGNVGLTAAASYIPGDTLVETIKGVDLDDGDDGAFGALQLQGRLDIGLTDSLDLGLTTGAGVFVIPYWTGAEVELKYAFLQNPDSISLAAGFDAGLSMPGLTVGGALYFDSNAPYFPLHISARPMVVFGDSGSNDDDDDGEIDDEESDDAPFFAINLAAGFHFDLSETTRLIIEATTYNPTGGDVDMFSLWNIGAGVQFVF